MAGRAPQRARAARAALLGAVALVAGCGGDADPAVAPDARAKLEQLAEAPFTSARTRVRLETDIRGFPVLGEQLSLTGSGPAAAHGPGRLPSLDWRLEFRGGGQSFPLRLRATPRNVYLQFMSRDYRLFDSDISGAGDGGPAAATTLAELGLAPADWFSSAELEAGPTLGGEPTARVSGELDAAAILADIAGFLVSDAAADVRAGAGDTGLPLARLAGLSGQLASLVESAQASVDVDGEGRLRRIDAAFEFEVPDGFDAAGIEGGTVELELALEELDVEVDVRDPRASDPIDELWRAADAIFGLGDL